jgi:pimeloyl-ACP methyl ester carboxylesterase
MTDFVLVHGAWHGAWCWNRILPRLWRSGHRAFAVSLTGVGERAHLLSGDIGLQTHINDVMAVIEAEELRHAVLVGHSYAGMVITGVADQLSDASRLNRLVYLDAMVPEPGESWSSGHSAETAAARRADIARDGTIPPPPPAVYGLTGEDADWVARRQTPHPGGMYDEALQFDPLRVTRWPRHFIDCTQPALPTIAASKKRVRETPGWRITEISSGHDPMISAPDALMNALLVVNQI